MSLINAIYQHGSDALPQKEECDKAAKHVEIATKAASIPVGKIMPVEQLRRSVGGIASYSVFRMRHRNALLDRTADITDLKCALLRKMQQVGWLHVLVRDLGAVQLPQPNRSVL